MSTEIIDVAKRYGAVSALRGVSLRVDEGEFVAILGPSGCGKTTLLRVVAGFEAPTAGEVRIAGRSVGQPDRSVPTERRNLGMVFQSFALWPHIDVAGHVRFPLDYQRHLPADIKAAKEARVAEVLDTIGLQDMGTRMPHELSGGQRQRVALARAIAARPALLLMDEPLSSLDAALRDEMRREIQNVHRATGASIVYVTHDQAEALAMADRVVVMLDGRVEQVGTPEDVFLRPESEFVARFVGKANLVEGVWDGTRFRPAVGGGEVVWDGSDVAAGFRERGLFPVRPDELEPRPADTAEGIPCVVRNVLFQGRDVHYTVEVGGTTWEVYSTARVEPGERVALSLRHRAPV
ncbi:MAG: ABC transporter ATP-binding protein [Streptosporangiales bacterium]